MKRWIAGLFDLEGNGTNLKTELIAGITTFLTMAYIAFVNPNILKAAGVPFGAAMTATCLAAAVGSIIMGIYANLPVGLAPAMGTNAYFAFSVCLGLGISWQVALGAVFLSGIAFLITTITGLREKLFDAIPDSMKHGIAAGIGLLIAFVGLKEAGIVVKNDATLVALGDMASPRCLVTMAGLAITTILIARKVRGALLLGILATAAIAVAFDVAKRPDAIVSMPPSLGPTFMAMDIKGALKLGLLEIIFVFFFVDIFDAVATLIGVAEQGGLMKKGPDGRMKLPRAGRALIADSAATILGAGMGTSTTTAYIESCAGIATGGRTGLTAVIVGLLFIAMLFFSPIVGMVPAEATAPALVIVCVYMMKNLKSIAWDDFTEAVPAAVAMLGIPLTFSISNGLALGFIIYPIAKILTGRWREANWLVYTLGVLFILKFIYLEGH
jgi:AGZA family xanthine/uracil permease-like MFS transporter